MSRKIRTGLDEPVVEPEIVAAPPVEPTAPTPLHEEQKPSGRKSKYGFGRLDVGKRLVYECGPGCDYPAAGPIKNAAYVYAHRAGIKFECSVMPTENGNRSTLTVERVR